MSKFRNVRSELVLVPMRDGVKLSVHVHRPDASGKFPAILQYTPYGKGPLKQYHPIVQHGYVTVDFDVRGTGNSAGSNDSVYCDAERQDGYDMVEWAAAQPWCNGNVGMWGISYGAVVALQIAAAAPPHLKAIIARSGTDDLHTEWTNPGGSPRPFIYGTYATIMSARNFAPPDPQEVGPGWRKIWKQRLDHNVPWGIPFIRNVKIGKFSRDRSLRGKYDRVKCAVYVVDGWADWYCTPLLRTFANVRTPKRALMGPWSHQWPDVAVPGPQIDWLNEALKWFGYWLKGEETGVMKEPPVTVFVREYSQPATILETDRGSFYSATEYPIANRTDTSMYFGEHQKLLPRPSGEAGRDTLQFNPLLGSSTGMHGGGPFNINWAMPLDQRTDEIHALTYTTAPLKKPVTVIGQPRAVLHFSSMAKLTQFVVKLCDVAPDGTSTLVTKGYVTVKDLQPGKVHRAEVELLACAYRFQKGHCLRISVASGDLLNVWPTPTLCTNTVHRGAAHPSHVTLPIIPETALRKAAIKSSGKPPVRAKDLTPPEFTITHDRINETATVRMGLSYAPHWTHKCAYTFSGREPARVEIDAESQLTTRYKGREIVTHAHCVTRSDHKSFQHIVEIKITEAGKLIWRKHWKTRVPRKAV